MRKSPNNISILSSGIREIRQAIELMVKRDTLRTLCAHSQLALAGCVGLLDGVLRSGRWQATTPTHLGMHQMRPVRCYAVVIRQERNPQVVDYRSVD